MKVLFALLMIATSLTASAQRRPVPGPGQGRIDLRGGQSTVRIIVNERNSTEARLRLLEEAVRDLQAQVYDLQDEPQFRLVQVCSISTPFDGTYIGKASGTLEATAIARQNCEQARKYSFCSSRLATCQTVEEVIRR